MNLADVRQEYQRERLRRESLKADPIAQFVAWLEEATTAAVIEPTAMTLATASREGQPLVRTVLLKGVDARGFVFFTNLGSRKARHIAENASVSLLFPWLALERQVIVTGHAEKLPASEVLAYFMSRPHESQLAAWASEQSAPITSRQVLETAWEQMKAKFGDGKVPLPSFWGGYRIAPRTIEFWQGGPSRLHDRFEYARDDAGAWQVQRLAP